MVLNKKTFISLFICVLDRVMLVQHYDLKFAHFVQEFSKEESERE